MARAFLFHAIESKAIKSLKNDFHLLIIIATDNKRLSYIRACLMAGRSLPFYLLSIQIQMSNPQKADEIDDLLLSLIRFNESTLRKAEIILDITKRIETLVNHKITDQVVFQEMLRLIKDQIDVNAHDIIGNTGEISDKVGDVLDKTRQALGLDAF